MEFTLAHTKYKNRDIIALASVDEIRADYILKGSILMSSAIYASELHKEINNVEKYTNEQLKQLIFGNNSNEIDLKVMEDIDLGFNAEGKFIRLRFHDKFQDGDRLEVIEYSHDLDDKQKIFIEREKKNKLKYELAGCKYKRHSFNGKYYSFVPDEEEYGGILREYAVIKNWTFMHREIQLNDVYLMSCYFYDVDKLSIRHLYGMIMNLARCDADIMYASLAKILAIDGVMLRIHNMQRCSIGDIRNTDMHLYNLEKLHIYRCDYSNIHFHKYINKSTLVMDGEGIFIEHFRCINIYFHEGIDMKELEELLSRMTLKNTTFRIHITAELWHKVDIKYSKNVEFLY